MTSYRPTTQTFREARMAIFKIPQLKRWEVTRFWDENFKYNPENGCLEWTKGVGNTGYGRTGLRGCNFAAHRVAYYIYYMEDPGDLMVRHKCDNPRCCHPFHLELGTHLDNMRDMVLRHRHQTGERHWMKRNSERFEELRRQGKFRNDNLPENGANHPRTVLTADNIREIFEKRAACNGDRKLIGKVNHELADKFGVTHSNISAVARGKSWQSVGEAPVNPHEMTPDKIREIRRRDAEGEVRASIARDFDLTVQTVRRIATRRSWKHIE